jgi:Tat protein translocase TatB subunit
MLDLGMQELIVIFAVALLVFGPKRLPELARTLGKGVGQVRKAMFDIKSGVEREIELSDDIAETRDIPSLKEESSPHETAEESADEAAKKSEEDEGPAPGGAPLEEDSQPGKDKDPERGA